MPLAIPGYSAPAEYNRCLLSRRCATDDTDRWLFLGSDQRAHPNPAEARKRAGIMRLVDSDMTGSLPPIHQCQRNADQRPRGTPLSRPSL